MLRFIRRVFILLILFTVIFLVYRYINPVGASRLVDDVKAIPDRISSFFQSEKKEDIKVEGNTTIISGDINLLDDNTEIIVDLKQDDSQDEELSWLQELNNEIDIILGKEKTEETIVEQENQKDDDIKKEEINTGDVSELLNGKFVDTIADNNTDDSELVKDGSTVIWGDCGQGLTQEECEELKTLGNIIK